MVKEKINIDVNALAKTVKILEKEIVERQETVKAIRTISDAKRVTEALDSTNESLKREISKNDKTLSDRRKVLALMSFEIIDKEKKVEAKKEESGNRIKEIEANEKRRIRDVRDNANERMMEVQREANEAVTSSKKMVKESGEKAMDAIAKKDKAEAEFNKLKEKMLA